jgi:ABC-2 type transport system ATP-binding protein
MGVLRTDTYRIDIYPEYLMPIPNLVTQSVTKRFGSARTIPVVSDISISVDNGEVYALVGPNGAGKTTLLKMIVGLLRPTSGTIVICGINSLEHPMEVKTHFGYVPDEPSGYDFLSGMEFLIFTGKVRGMDSASLQARIRHLENIFPLGDTLSQPISEYSRGVKQKVLVLAALLTNPDILIIDEPIVGLDPPSIKILGNLFRTYAQSGHSVIFVTHILDFALRYATKAGVMKSGKLIREVAITKTTKSDTLL